jgi:microcystin-dependent protein
MDPTLAVITMFGGNFPPRGWANCNGQILSIAQNTALFSLLGTTFGGNGQTTFGLPDLRGRTPIQPGLGPGLSPNALGQTGGAEFTTLLTNNLPVHTHLAAFNFAVSNGTANSDEPGGRVPANRANPAYRASGVPTDQLALGGVSATMDNTGNSQPISLRQPYLGINFIIALEGIFPSRN